MRIRIRKSVVSEALDGETVVLDMHTGVYFALNATATRAWHLIAQGFDFDALVTKMHGELDVDREELTRDLRALVDELAQRRLIDVETAAP